MQCLLYVAETCTSSECLLIGKPPPSYAWEVSASGAEVRLSHCQCLMKTSCPHVSQLMHGYMHMSKLAFLEFRCFIIIIMTYS